MMIFKKIHVTGEKHHQCIQITVGVYGHLIPSSSRGAVNRLDTPQPSATQPQPALTEKP
jgi:hypothetical protein